MSAQPQDRVETVNIEVDGIAMQVPRDSMIIEATDKAGISIPRFCYHSKLSVAANCRMCLVDIEKAPKPMPACATPVAEGMKVYTQSRRAIDAQHGVMEFLLINHPLDCPICDQGGECELQDLAMGYGRSVSRFSERKRVVEDHDIGPLVQTDLTRCIQCTRCVRFLDEIAGTDELGMFGRGDRSSIGTALEQGLDSELSGNVIDLCPVGALTNKPFRFSARAWELIARPSTAVHDGVGSELWYHLRRDRIMRAVPKDNEASNETWLADRDRYSHFGLYARDRVSAPMVKTDGEWRTTGWDEAIQLVARALRNSVGEYGAGQLGVLMSPSVSCEEYFLAQRLARGLDCPNIDHRLREQDFSDDPAGIGSTPFAAPMAALDDAGAIVLLGCNIRQEAPILGQRVRKAWRRGAQVAALNPVDWNFHFTLSRKRISPPQQMPAELAALARAVANVTGKEIPAAMLPLTEAAAPDEAHTAIAGMLAGEGNRVLILGQAAMAHGQSAWLRRLARWIAAATGATLDLLPHGGNTAGAVMTGAVPGQGAGGREVAAGLNARAMLQTPLKAYLLWDAEPDYDIANPAMAMAALGEAAEVVAVSAFAGESLKAIADVILPLAPFAEAGGVVYTLDGRRKVVEAAAPSPGEAKPGWKILRRLGTELELEGFSQADIGALRGEMDTEMQDAADAGERAEVNLPPVDGPAPDDLYRIGEVAMYGVDSLCRRSEHLQRTVHADNDFVALNSADASRLGLVDGQRVRIRQGGAEVILPLRQTDRVPAGGAWLKSAGPAVSGLGDSFGPVSVEAA